MFSMVRIFLVLLMSSLVALAQEQAAPEPSATATPDATPAQPDPTPAAPASPSDSPASAADAPPAPALEAGTPAPSPSPASDVIPMDGQAPPPPPEAPAAVSETQSPSSEGVPLETEDLSPPLPSGNVPDAAFTDPNAIVPDEAPAPPAMPQGADNALEKARALTIRYREVKVQADKDPTVLRMYERSTLAKTDEDKRAALREYYRLLFAKMVSIDKELEQKCKVMQDAYLRRLAQERLEPTIPLNPPPTPEPLGR